MTSFDEEVTSEYTVKAFDVVREEKRISGVHRLDPLAEALAENERLKADLAAAQAAAKEHADRAHRYARTIEVLQRRGDSRRE